MLQIEGLLASVDLVEDDIPRWQLEQLNDEGVERLVRELVSDVITAIAPEHFSEIRDSAGLAANGDKAQAAIIDKFQAVGRDKKTDFAQIVTATKELEQHVLGLLGEKFLYEQWGLFLKGVGEINGLSIAELNHLANETRENPEQAIGILARLYLSESQEWFTLLSTDFISTYLRFVKQYPQNFVRQFINRKTIQLINFLIAKILQHSHLLIPNVSGSTSLSLAVGSDGELELFPHSWQALATEFKSSQNYSVQAWCRILLSVQQFHTQLDAIGDPKNGLTSKHLELQPVQIFMEMKRLALNLQLWANDYDEAMVNWLDSKGHLFKLLDMNAADNTRLSRSLHALLYGMEPSNDGQSVTLIATSWQQTAVTSFCKLEDIAQLIEGGVQQKLEHMLIISQNMMTVLQDLEFEDSGVKAEWDVWFLGYQEELSALVNWIGRVLKGEDVRKEKGKRLGDDVDGEQDESVITDEGAAPVIRLTQ